MCARGIAWCVAQLSLTWALPSHNAHYLSKPTHYIEHLLGHEGPGSLYSLLKRSGASALISRSRIDGFELRTAGWITGLTAGCENSGHQQNSAFWLFNCTLYLTDEGFDKRVKVVALECPLYRLTAHLVQLVELVFDYLRLLKRTGPQKWAWEELKAVGDMSFRFVEKVEPIEYAEELSVHLHRYPAQHVLSGTLIASEAVQ